jgi:hypothetical protein
VLGVDKRNIIKTLEWRIQMDTINTAFWITQKGQYTLTPYVHPSEILWFS